MVHHVVRSARRSLCSNGELSGLFLILCRRIPSLPTSMPFLTARDFHWAQQFCTWGCGRRCLSLLGAAQSLLPPERALYLGDVACSLLKAVGSQPAKATATTARTCWMSARASTFGTDYTLLCMGVATGHRHCCVFGLDGALK